MHEAPQSNNRMEARQLLGSKYDLSVLIFLDILGEEVGKSMLAELARRLEAGTARMR